MSAVAVAAIFLSNIPEGLSSAAGMKQAGRSARYVFGVWTGIAVISGVASLLGYTLFRGASPGVVAATTATTAGAMLALLADTMIPEVFEVAHDFAGAHHGGRVARVVRARPWRRVCCTTHMIGGCGFGASSGHPPHPLNPPRVWVVVSRRPTNAVARPTLRGGRV